MAVAGCAVVRPRSVVIRAAARPGRALGAARATATGTPRSAGGVVADPAHEPIPPSTPDRHGPQPGVTIEQLWKHILPASGPGRLRHRLPDAGAAAANIHGKNNFKVGTLGDQILLRPRAPSGELGTRTGENADLFHAAIGGFGMLGCFTRIELKTQRALGRAARVRQPRPR
jgi:hypothetical protein